MLAVADTKALILLMFVEEEEVKTVLSKIEIGLIFSNPNGCSLISEKTWLLDQTEKEIALYFEGKLSTFSVATRQEGTAFQLKIWDSVCKVNYGAVSSYKDIAHSSGHKKAYRAAGSTIGKNQLAIIVPCHRIICSNKKLGEYAYTADRKAWLLNHEKKFFPPV